MPKQGRFPGKDAELNNYFQVAILYILLNKTRLRLSQEDEDTLNDLFGEWNVKYPLSQNENTRTKITIKDKEDAKDRLIVFLRKVYADIPNSVLTNQDRITLNLLSRDTSRTPTAVPFTKPVVLVDTRNHLEHTISFSNIDGSKKKPEGVRACQIWYKIGSAPIDPSELTYMASDTASPYIHHFEGKDAGKNIYYWLRWENTRGEVGPWSDAIMATILG
ncbi:hypothetical protein OX284_012280 [Flavobacterium sp. SUN046]|uniref:hypothetical protein n=1 Tax=Flavobacterium sp. SUN046 TaxID=3002440 RepID=UPI002DBB9C94|nr:hypothetical protein [Flavobacterium sp. SUN046]MEC4050211.1 hypothetical protein [Flavobacterium sp. SUN046]